MSETYTLLDVAYAAARWGWFIAVFLILGAGSYAPFLFRARTGLEATDPVIASSLPRRAAGIGYTASLLLLVFTVFRLYLQSRSMLDPADPVTSDVVKAVLETDWGAGWKRQAVLAVLSALAFGAAKTGSSLGWMVGTAAGGGLGLAAGMTGHAVTDRAGSTGFVLDAAHVWAGGFWVGGLAVLLMAGLSASRQLPSSRRPLVVRALVADFSRRALLFGPLTIGLGVWLAVQYMGWSWPLELFESGYGKTLALKLGVLLVIAALGAYHWKVAQPALGDPAGEGRFRRSALFEVMFGAILLAVTAVLVSLPLPGEHP